jgi:acetylornithine deacetylase
MPALRSQVSQQAIDTVRGVVTHATDREPKVGGVPFGTDAGPLGAAGLACLVVGPGDIAQAHTRDEWIDLDQLRAAVDVYRGIACAFG